MDYFIGEELMKKIRKLDDRIYRRYIEHDSYAYELKKGLCYKEQGKHFIRCNFDEDVLNYFIFLKPCCCKDCTNNTRLEDVNENSILLPKEEDIINNYKKSRELSEEKLEIWWQNFQYDKDDYMKVVKIINLSNRKACYSNKDYPNLECKGYYMCYDILFKVEDIIENKYISEELDKEELDDLFSYRWENIDVNMKMDVYKTIMNSKVNLENYNIEIKCA